MLFKKWTYFNEKLKGFFKRIDQNMHCWPLALGFMVPSPQVLPPQPQRMPPFDCGTRATSLWRSCLAQLKSLGDIRCGTKLNALSSEILF